MEFNDLYDSEQFEILKCEIEQYNNKQLYHKAILRLRDLIRYFPKHSGLYYLIALTYFKCKEYFKGVDNFKIGLANSNGNHEHLGLVGYCFLCLNDLENSYNYARKAYEKEEDNLDALITLGKIELLRGNYEDALSYGVSAIEIKNDSFDALRLLSKIYICMGVDDKDALKILYKVRELGNDEELNLDIIKMLYLNQKYMLCLAECKNVVMNHETGYVIEKAKKYIDEIQNKVEVNSNQTIEELMRVNKSKRGKDLSFKNPTIEKIDDVLGCMQNGEISEKNDYRAMYENEKKEFIEEIRISMREIDYKDIVVSVDESYHFDSNEYYVENSDIHKYDNYDEHLNADQGYNDDMINHDQYEYKEDIKISNSNTYDDDIIIHDYEQNDYNSYVVNTRNDNKYYSSESNIYEDQNNISNDNKLFEESSSQYLDNHIEESNEINNSTVRIKENVKNENAPTGFKRIIEERPVTRNSSSLLEALEKINELTGLKNVKKEIYKIVNLMKYENNREQVLGIGNDSVKAYHFSFLGNPGTGKTTVARLIGDIFYYLGILEKGQLVEVDRSDIVGRYVGETAILTRKAIDKAMGGILFIDEAYSLAKGSYDGDDFGKEAIETLLKAMEDHRGKFTVIFAGYTNEMKNLFNLNPGLKSRVNLEINFEDYDEFELCDIAKKIARQENYILSPDGERAFLEKINIEKVDENFANARCARNILEAAIREKAFRIGDEYATKEELVTLRSEDFGIDLEFRARESVEDIIDELNDLIGLYEIKDVIKGILNTLELQHRKKEIGIECDDIPLNMIFSGNPGTGKTTVARIIGKILKSMGILKKGHMVEVTRSDLVGQFVGQTAPKTLAKIREAYGGILFIDEAYSLNGDERDSFGKEAITTLIKEMEDNRDKLIVIMAGYTSEMYELLNVNPGLESRINFNLEFNDYDEYEMYGIFETLCNKEHYIITEEAYMKVQNVFYDMVINKDKNFGNARVVRKYFEDMKMRQANRIINDNILMEEELLMITEEDIV